MRYLQGHLPGAVSVPAPRAFDADGRLRPPAELAAWLGAAGLSDDFTPLVYDSHDGQRGALLVWLLEYLGRADVRLLDVYYEAWRAAGQPIAYRATPPRSAAFTPRLDPGVRAELATVREGAQVLLDVRSWEEYAGTAEGDPRPGHIPGARHLAWRELAGPPRGRYLAPAEQVRAALVRCGVEPGQTVIAYCRQGPRAALAYLALQQAGYLVRLFDGSYAAWAAAGLPVEGGPLLPGES
jgi:thiosulfate/3-mercaptopyruvate sulfurtransferase